MADFFSRIFAIPSDDESSDGASTYSQPSIQRHSSPRKKPHQKKSGSHNRRSHSEDDEDEIEESSTSASIESNLKRGRQRRNDASSSYRSASEGPRGSGEKHKKRSSSERPKAASPSASGNNASLSARRPARSLSKVAERERETSSSMMDDEETQRKMKGWRSKFSKGMKKHLSPTAASTSSSPPLPSKTRKDPHAKSPTNSHAQTNKATSNRNASTSNRNVSSGTKRPINVGDYITLSQQYLEDNDMSVLTLPKELKDLNNTTAMVDMDENLQIYMGQRGVLGNNAVQAFLDRRCTPHSSADVATSSTFPAVDGTDETNSILPAVNGTIPETNSNDNTLQHENGLQQSTSNESRVYERVSSYATKLLDISYSQSLENTSQDQGCEVEVNDALLAYANRQMSGTSRHVWPCDPTAEGYAPNNGAAKDPNDNVDVHNKDKLIGSSEGMAENGIMPEDPSLSSPGGGRRPLDKEDDEEEDGDRPFRSFNKSVSFNIPPQQPSSSHPPAPPFLGPNFDYYYSVERDPNDSTPLWSNHSILPPIIELWSNVEDGAATTASGWNAVKEMELIGEDNPLIFDDLVKLPDARADVDTPTKKEPVILRPTSPGEKSIEHLINILDCGDEEEEAPLDEKEGLIKQTTSSLSIKTDPATSTETEPDATFRHRSQWKSSHNMTYKPPMFNKDSSTLHKMMGRSESSEDSVLQLRRIHEDDVPSPKNHAEHLSTTSKPVILHGRVVRHANVSPNASSSLSKTVIARSPSTASYGSIASSSNAKTYAAIAIQASARGMLERQRFMDMISSVLVIQTAVRRFLCRCRLVVMRKLRRSYFSSNWKRRVENGV
ncbi:hypothetical protein ACHAXN_008055 [Cyclotella atomus]